MLECKASVKAKVLSKSNVVGEGESYVEKDDMWRAGIIEGFMIGAIGKCDGGVVPNSHLTANERWIAWWLHWSLLLLPLTNRVWQWSIGLWTERWLCGTALVVNAGLTTWSSTCRDDDWGPDWSVWHNPPHGSRISGQFPRSMPYADRNAPLSSIPTVIWEPESLVRSSLVDETEYLVLYFPMYGCQMIVRLRDKGWTIFSEEPSIGEVKLSQTR